MIPLVLRFPGLREGRTLPALLAHPGPLWIHGAPGSGVSGLVRHLAAERACEALDDADLLDPGALSGWLREHPRGVLGAHRSPEDPAVAVAAQACLAWRLPSLEEQPGLPALVLELMAREEGLEGPLPSLLATLPCPGNLRGLRNRLLRWKLLGQLPEPPLEALPLESDDLAVNLHALERQLLHRALKRSYGNRVEAARRMGVSRQQLYLLIARHGDPVRGEAPSGPTPRRLQRSRQRSAPPPADPAQDGQNSSPDRKRR